MDLAEVMDERGQVGEEGDGRGGQWRWQLGGDERSQLLALR